MTEGWRACTPHPIGTTLLAAPVGQGETSVQRTFRKGTPLMVCTQADGNAWFLNHGITKHDATIRQHGRCSWCGRRAGEDGGMFVVGQHVEVRFTTYDGDKWEPTRILKTYGPVGRVVEIEAFTPAGKSYMYRVRVDDVRPLTTSV